MGSLVKYLRSGAIAALVSTPVWADDTDIYLNNNPLDVGVARVMLTIDFRANVGSTICQDAVSDDCIATMGNQLYEHMDLYGADGTRGADGFADALQPSPTDAAPATLRDSHWPRTKTNLYDVLRTVFRVVIDQLGDKIAADPTLSKLEIGLIVPHEGDCNGAGPAMLPTGLSPTYCSQGAYVLQGFTDISVEANRNQLYIKMAAVPEPGDRAPWMNRAWNGHSYKIRDIYFEFYRYITGKGVFNGYLGFSDYNTQVPSGNLYQQWPDNDVLFDIYRGGTADETWLEPDPDAMDPAGFSLGTPTNLSSARYQSPLGANDDCTSLYMINAMFGTTGNSHGDTDAAISVAPGPASATGGLGLSLSGGQDDMDAQLVGSMFGTDFGDPAYGLADIAGDQNVTSFVISDKVRTNTNAIAAAGGTGQAYPLSDPQTALAAIEGIFGEILSVSTTFVAASIPTNVFNRSRAVDNIYFALFQAEKEPRWDGNVKKLRIASLEVTDPNTQEVTYEKIIAEAPLADPPVRAISNVDGRIRTNALTFWTNPAGADVVAFDPNESEVTGKDGRSITRGGAGQQIPGWLSDTIGQDNSGARKVFTEDPNNPGAAIALASNMDLAGISAYLDPNDVLTDTEEAQLVDWIRGLDAYNATPGQRTDSRSWVMADPMHSRPLVVNYGHREGTSYSEANPDIRLFFGTNSGMIHFVQNTTTAPAESGRETAAFIPLELLSMQYTLAQNQAQAVLPHPYGMDGEAVSYVDDKDLDGNIENSSDGDTVWVFMGQRRGGKGLWAFDVTDPDSPSLMWKITNETAGFEQLAMTFSTPQVVKMDLGDALGVDDGEDDTPVLIFAGGYNGGWNGGSRVGKDAGDADDEIGNAVYIVKAATGELIWKAVGPDGSGICADTLTNYCVDGSGDSVDGTSFTRPSLVDSIPSEMAVVDSDNNNVPDRAYVGDSGGNVWRVELTEDKYKVGSTLRHSDNWYVTKLGNFGGSGVNDRRFFHAPDYVKARERDTKNPYDGVILTSGDRADPLETVVQNFAFMIKDLLTVTNSGPEIKLRQPYDALDPNDSIYGIADITDHCISGDAVEDACAALDTTNGWKLSLEDAGEKGLSRPLTSNGVVLFTTYVPNVGAAEDQCKPPEGLGYAYLVNLVDGSAAFDLAAEINVWTKDDRRSEIGPGIPGDIIPYEDEVLIPGKGIKGKQIFKIPGKSLWRVYWREDEIDQ